MEIQRTNSDAMVVNRLPDGSTVIVDPSSDTVFALNATAGAAWDACSDSTTLSGVTEIMRRSLDEGIDEDVAEEAILRLQDKNLVKTSGGTLRTRRDFIATVSTFAIPMVVALSVAEQRAYATIAKSSIKPTPTPIHKPVSPTPIPKPILTGSLQNLLSKLLSLWPKG